MSLRTNLWLVLALLLAWPGAAHAACEVKQRATVPFATVSGVMLVPLTVNGIAARFVLDTGAERSMVAPDSVRRLGLALDEWVGTTMRGVGGLVEHQNAKPRSLAMGGIALQRATIAHDTSLTVGTPPALTEAYDGLLGRDFLSVFDLQFDMTAHSVTLFDVRGCAGRFLPWSPPYDAIRADSPMSHALVLPIDIDGHRLRALLDTGASSTLIALPGMMRLGLTPAALAGDTGRAARGIGPQTPEMRRHRFASLQIGATTQHDPLLWVAPVRLTPIVDALLGGDWLLAQRRVWISFATSQVFVTSS